MSHGVQLSNRLAAPVSRGRGLEISPAAIADALWRQKRMIVLWGVLAAVLAAVPALMMTRSYSSTTQLLIDPRGLRVMEKDIAPQAREPDLSVSIIESEMRFLASDRVLQRVIDALQLDHQPEGPSSASALDGVKALLAPLRGLLDQGKALLGRADIAAMTPQQAAMQTLQKSIRVARHPNTYVIDLTITGKDREQRATWRTFAPVAPSSTGSERRCSDRSPATTWWSSTPASPGAIG